MGKLAGKVAIVTGGGRGIGRAIAQAYLQEDAEVVVTAAREKAEIEGLVEEAAPEKALAILAHVTDPEDCERVVTGTVERFRKLVVLVNNAGRGMKDVSPEFLTEPPRFWETDSEVWKMIVDINVNGPFFMAQGVVPRMLETGGRRIVNVSINYGPMKRRGFSPYGPSKAALESESIIWAQDLEETGIRLNALLPGGATETGMMPLGLSEEMRSRLLRPGIVAGPAIYRASEDSSHLTGHRLGLGSGALDLCYVAAGRLDECYEQGFSAWDVAAGVLIVEEAGGKITDYRGHGLDPEESEGLVASNGPLHPDLIRVTREYHC